MAALNRLSQRIKENFQETTRDISLLAGGSSSSSTAYLDAASEDKVKEISKLLESRQDKERLEGMKRIIAGVSKGRDMEVFFAQVVKNVVAPSVEIRKLVYIFLLRYASSNSDLLLLSINTFQKDLSDSSPLIRSMSLRVLTSIRVPIIQGIVMLGLKKLVNDRNPWVRKTVAGGLAKVYEMDASSLSQLIPLLQTLLSSPSPLTLGATLTAFSEICPDRLDLLHPYYRHICRLLVDADEWGQAVALPVLTRYAREMLERPEDAGPTEPVPTPTKAAGQAGMAKGGAGAAESEDEFEGLDEDLAMLLHCSKPLFHSRNPAVVLALAKMYYHLAPASNIAVGQDQLVAPLLRLAGSSAGREGAGNEIATLTWNGIASMVEERPWLFAKHHTRFFVHSADPTSIKVVKIRVMTALISAENAAASVREFKHYVRFRDDLVAEEAIRALGHCVRTQSSVAASGLTALMRALRSHRDALVASSVLVLKSVVLSRPTISQLPSPQKLVARLAKSLDGISNPSARASVFWLAGQFAAADEAAMLGLGWEGVAPWVPDVLRNGVKGFGTESTIVKLQILTLAAKLLVLASATSQLVLLSQYLFTLARYDAEYDVRDRSRFLAGLLRGVRAEKPKSLPASGEDGMNEGEEAMSGVVLRREQVKVVLLGRRDVCEEVSAGKGEFEVGSTSRQLGRRLGGYEAVPEWTDDPTDPSLREVEKVRSEAPTPASIPPVSAPQAQANAGPSPVPPRLASVPAMPGRSSSPLPPSPAGSVPRETKATFKDLDAFLNSESEETDESEEDAPARPVAAPPRSAIVPEYDESSEEEEDDVSDGETSDEEEELERAPLYGRYT